MFVFDDPADKIRQHFLRHFKIGNDAVNKRPDGADVAGRPAEHSFGFVAYGHHLAGFLIYRHHRRFVYHDSPAADIDKSVGRAEVNADTAGKHFFESAEHIFIL